MTNPNILAIIQKQKDKIQMIPIRVGFGEGLLLAGKYDENVVALCADLTESTQTHFFKEVYPNRFFEIGIAEQNMASVASGMAAMGKIPFMASYAMFSPGRNWEQIRTTICYNNVPVKIIGAHAGLSVGPDGGTHQALEDIALMRVIPNCIVIVPCDALEAKKATLAIAKNNMPSYLRLAREKSPIITQESDIFEIGKAKILYSSNENEQNKNKKLGIIACGEMVAVSLSAISELEKNNIKVSVLNLHTIKPIDENAIINFVNSNKNILTVEEHQLAGGMSSGILECIADNSDKISFSDFKIKRIGIQNDFGQSGTKQELFAYYKIDENEIIKQAKSFFE
jgi:transketolase